jgi:hypothetical protein
VVSVNITQEQQAKLSRLIPAEKVLLADDVHLSSPLCQDSAALRKRLQGMFAPMFPFALNQADIALLRRVIWPEVVIKLPLRAGGGIVPPPTDSWIWCRNLWYSAWTPGKL